MVKICLSEICLSEICHTQFGALRHRLRMQDKQRRRVEPWPRSSHLRLWLFHPWHVASQSDAMGYGSTLGARDRAA